MVKFLIHRPIAASMSLIAILVLGLVSISEIPVSLMPDTDIPEISVQLGKKNTSARELENTLMKPLRRQLMQVPHLADIHSESRDEQGVIKLKFEYGTDINLAFIEVNEMIDRAMSRFPREIQRPKAIKASASDIPVFYLNLSLKKEGPETYGRYINQDIEAQHQLVPERDLLFPVSQDFVELSRFSSRVIRQRLEQFPAVAMVDISGQVYSELLVIPDIPMLESLNVTLEKLESIIRNSNINLGNLLIRDGQYQYNVRFNSTLENKRDIENIYLKIQGRLLQLKDIVRVIEHPQKQKGMVASDGKNAITMAIIKQSDARMDELKSSLYDEVERLRQVYPEIEFTIARDQTRLLDYSISNLGQSLIWGALLAFLVMFLFLRDLKSPLLIGITIPASLVISLLLFYIAGISINIISLSGLVLGVGMMIDNSIIVIDNITQHRERGRQLDEACIKGVNEVVRPMISSVLTTCAVFIPLIFLGGIAGALFYDQALAVAIGLFVSLAVSVAVLPVYYRLFYRKGKEQGTNKLLNKLNALNYEGLYEKGFRKVMRKQPLSWILFMVGIAGAVLLFSSLPKSKLPPITKDELVLRIDWNEKIHVRENNRRTQQLLAGVDSLLVHNTALIGEQQFLLDKEAMAGAPEALIYLKARSPEALALVQERIDMQMQNHHDNAVYHFEDAENIFNLIFTDNEPPLVVRLRMRDDYGPQRNEVLQRSLAGIQQALPEIPFKSIPWQEHTVLMADPVKLMVYDISPDQLFGKLKAAFNEREVMVITENQDFVPVILGGKPLLMDEVLQTTYIRNREGKSYPVRDLIKESTGYDLKTIIAGQDGEYYPVEMNITEEKLPSVTADIKAALQKEDLMEAGFSGSIFSNRALMKQLALILTISLALLYFILAAQFESLKLPLIVLLEIPVGIFGAFLFLKLFGNSINLMSMIGIVVMSGIVINDSPLQV
jgi:multidrug efflux pump subunit AcrB